LWPAHTIAAALVLFYGCLSRLGGSLAVRMR